MPLSQIGKSKEKAKGKRKAAEAGANTNPVQKISVFPKTTTTAPKMRTRYATSSQNEVPSPTRKSKRKQSVPERIETVALLEQPLT